MTSQKISLYIDFFMRKRRFASNSTMSINLLVVPDGLAAKKLIYYLEKKLDRISTV